MTDLTTRKESGRIETNDGEPAESVGGNREKTTSRRKPCTGGDEPRVSHLYTVRSIYASGLR